MTISKALRWGFDKFKKVGIDSYQLDTELLLVKALFHPEKPTEKEFLKYVEKIDRQNLYKITQNTEITKTQKRAFESLIGKRAKRIPITYLTNVKEFCGLLFYVDERVLIPRPQTEPLVERVIQETNVTIQQCVNTTIVDVGTGSGCMIASIVKKLQEHFAIATPHFAGKAISFRAFNRDRHASEASARDDNVVHFEFIATDTSSVALNVAKRNARIHSVTKSIKFIKMGSLPITKSDSLMIVANLPYLDAAKKTYFLKTSPELKYEPKATLFAQHNGLAHYFALIAQISKIKKKQISCFFEIDPHQRAELTRRIRAVLHPAALSFASGIISFTLRSASTRQLFGGKVVPLS